MHEQTQSTWVLVLIGVGKLFKAAALLFVALQAHRLLLSSDAAEMVKHWIHSLRIDPENKHLHGFISRVSGISHKQLEEIRLGSFIYAALFIIEGTGLAMRKVWAEYMTAITTGLLLPVEAYEIFHGHHHAVKVIVFVVNVAILVYLIVQLKKRHEKRKHERTM